MSTFTVRTIWERRKQGSILSERLRLNDRIVPRPRDADAHFVGTSENDSAKYGREGIHEAYTEVMVYAVRKSGRIIRQMKVEGQADTFRSIAMC